MNETNQTDALAARVAREKLAHEDSRIDDALQKWWAVFPHVFKNPSMDQLGAFYRSELGAVKNKEILEYGCGQGDFAIWLLRQEARVTGIDISDFNVAACMEKAEAQRINRNLYSFMTMDAHNLAFSDNSFDLVVGNGILHHLELAHALIEVDRVLKPGAKALFQEPLGSNPLLKLYRLLAGIHTVDERPLTRADLDYMKACWNVQPRYSGLLTMPAALVSSIFLPSYANNWLLQFAARAEMWLNERHVLNHWNRFALLIYKKPDSYEL